MRELPCDFCGEDADGVYEPLPRVDDGRRVALCAACRGTLADLLEPLEGAGSRRSDAAPSSTDASESGDKRAGSESPKPETEADTEESADPTGDDESDRTVNDDPAGETEEAEETEGAAETDETAADETNESDAPTRAEEPPGFRKVMRLLNNRSFPLERAVAVELASGAYDLSESEVEATLEYAVERGVLAVSEGELRRT